MHPRNKLRIETVVIHDLQSAKKSKTAAPPPFWGDKHWNSQFHLPEPDDRQVTGSTP